MTAEGTLRAAVLKRIREDYPPSRREVLVFGRPAGPSTGPGHPDLFGVACGHFLALEIKTDKSKPTPIQISRIQDLRMAGAYAWVIRSTLDATRAIYQAKTGGPVPNSTDDPIDFDDWFNQITGGAAETPPAPAMHPVEQAAIESGIGVAPPVFAPDEDAEAVTEMPETNGSGKHPDPLEGYSQRSVDAESPYAPSIQAEADVEQAAAYIVETIKAVGDRVTEVWEVANRIETQQRYLLTQFRRLLAEVGVEETPEPEPIQQVEVTPLDPPVRRTRRRKTDAS